VRRTDWITTDRVSSAIGITWAVRRNAAFFVGSATSVILVGRIVLMAFLIRRRGGSVRSAFGVSARPSWLGHDGRFRLDLPACGLFECGALLGLVPAESGSERSCTRPKSRPGTAPT